jgi:surfeit locus 1 family protein
MPWLTAITALMLALLISLGVWQYQRLQWKTALLAEVEASVTAPPLTSLDDLERAIAAGEPVDFRRIIFEAAPSPDRPIYAVYKTQAGGIYWDLFREYGTIFGRYDTVADTEKPTEAILNAGGPTGGANIGYVREDHPMGRVEAWSKSKPNRQTNRWFKFNQDGSWGEGMPSSSRLTHYIEIDPNAQSAEALPIRRPSIRNNHRDYMLTWFSFAFLLLVFYALIHHRAGRLTW